MKVTQSHCLPCDCFAIEMQSVQLLSAIEMSKATKV